MLDHAIGNLFTLQCVATVVQFENLEFRLVEEEIADNFYQLLTHSLLFA